MDNVHYRPAWRRIIALAGLLSLLCLSVVSASHLHSGVTTGSVKNECQLCLTGGVNRTLPANTQAFATVVLTFFLLATLPKRSSSTRTARSVTPRAPPLS
jgi:hypothetical protein